eukprot:7387754-Prymnesium_polylepis.1
MARRLLCSQRVATRWMMVGGDNACARATSRILGILSQTDKKTRVDGFSRRSNPTARVHDREHGKQKEHRQREEDEIEVDSRGGVAKPKGAAHVRGGIARLDEQDTRVHEHERQIDQRRQLGILGPPVRRDQEMQREEGDAEEESHKNAGLL